jgi:hypothetical protein
MDFEVNAKDGFELIGRSGMKAFSWYDYESFAGISGQRRISQLPDGKFLPPIPFKCVEDEFRSKMMQRMPDRKITNARVANLTAPLQEARGTCQF